LHPTASEETTVIKLTVLYANKDGGRFDMDYYCKKHFPMVQAKLGAALKGVAIEQGISGGAPGSRPAYAAIGHLYFDSVDSYQKAFGPHAAAIMADIPNYTNVEPTVLVSEVKM